MELYDLNLDGSDGEDDKQSDDLPEDGEALDNESETEQNDEHQDCDKNEEEDIMPDDTLDPSASNTGEME